METFGSRLKKLRLEAGISMSEVAEKINKDVRTYEYYEADKTSPSYEVLLKFYSIFDWSISYLILGEENDTGKAKLDRFLDACPEEKRSDLFSFIDLACSYMELKKKKTKQFQYCLFKYRMEHELTVSRMADILEITTARYNRLENGESVPDLALISRVYEKLNIDPLYFITGICKNKRAYDKRIQELDDEQQERLFYYIEKYNDLI